MSIERGQHVVVVDAFGAELSRIALGEPVLGEDFPVVWVCRPEVWEQAQREGHDPEGVPWPLEDVRVADREPA